MNDVTIAKCHCCGQEMHPSDHNDRLRAEVASLKEQNALLTVQVQRHQWQPIETAPRDGTPVDLWHKSGGRIPETWWDEEDQCWSCVMDDDCFSHWMPMPEVPGISALPQQVKSEDARDADFDSEAERIFTEELTGAVGRINPDATCIDDIFIFDDASPDAAISAQD